MMARNEPHLHLLDLYLIDISQLKELGIGYFKRLHKRAYDK